MLIKITFSIAPVFILFQVGEKSYLFGLHDMIIEQGPRQGQNSTLEAFKHWCSLTPLKKKLFSIDPSFQVFNLKKIDIQNLANFSKKLAFLVELTLQKKKFPKIPNFLIKKKSVKLKHCLLLSGNPPF
jgi:hypothetical protein